jgi:AcrR family transcriptional regulator
VSRSPSTQAHEAVLSTALKLMTDRGIEATSVDEIAQVSGVSKATIYKHWTSKDDLCIEAIGRLKCDLPVFESGDRRADVSDLLRHLAFSKKPEALSRIWPRVIGYAASNAAFAKAFRARMADGPRTQLAALVKSAVEKGQLQAGIDVEMALDVLLGPIFYRRFMQDAVPQELPEYVLDCFWRVNAANGAAPGAEGAKRNNGGPNGGRRNGTSHHPMTLVRRTR